MKISHWSLMGYVVAVALATFMDVRYLWIYYDISEAFLWTSISALILSASWLYDRQMKMNNTIDALEEYISDLNIGKEK